MQQHDQQLLHLNSNAGCRDGLGLDSTVTSVDASLTAHHSKSQGQRESSALHNRIANEGLSISGESVRLTTNRPAMTDEGINQLSFNCHIHTRRVKSVAYST